MGKLTFVTAFFPIGRDSWKKFTRSSDIYFDYFSFWAGMENDLVVYTTPDSVERVKSIREGYGRSNTCVIAIEDLTAVDPEMYAKISETMSNRWFPAVHENPKCPESWNASYIYLMAMKCWFLADAADKGFINGDAVWIDFGYNHGDGYYLDSADFRFDWQYDLGGKVTMFQVKEDDGRPMFELIRSMETFIEGSIFLVPKDFCGTLFQMFRDNVFALAKAGIVDDDQSVLLMCVKDRPEMFNLVFCKWFQDIEILSGRKFTVREIPEENPRSKAFKLRMKRLWKATRYSLSTIKYRI